MVILCVWACVPPSNVIRIPHGILDTDNFGAPLRTIFGDELSECQCDVGLSLRCFRLRSLKMDVPTFEDRCVDFRRSTIDVLTFED